VTWCDGSGEEARFSRCDLVYVFDSDDDYSFWRRRSCATEFDAPVCVIERGRIVAVQLLTAKQVFQLFGFDRGLDDASGARQAETGS
jgi:hypothetical protein